MTERDHDAPMGRLLREAMRGGDHAAPSDCLDPETLAAWVEGSLPASERSFAEAHAARCSRCQAMLAAMARTLPASAPASSALRNWLIVLGPAAGVAAAVALWFAVEPRMGTFERGAPLPVAVESAAPATTQTEIRLGGTASADLNPNLNKEVKKDAADEREASPRPLEDAREDASRRETPASTQVKRAQRSAAAKEAPRIQAEPPVQADQPQLRAAASPPPPPAPLPQPEAAQLQAIPAPAQQAPAPVAGPAQQPGQSQQAADRQAVEGQKAAQAPQEPTPTSDRVARSAERAGARAENDRIGELSETVAMRVADVGTFSVAPRDGSVLWRVLGGRTVQQSADAGKTWTTQYTADEGMVLLAGAAPSSTACWLVGRTGAVFVTADGRTWQRAGFPATVDLIGVTATDARAAVVTTADKRTFSTADGGHSWTERRN